jgi:hypothetical protein
MGLQAGEIAVRDGRVMEVEHHLEEGIAAELALGTDLPHQPLEGHVLVRVGLQADLAHPSEQGAEVGISG